MSLTYDQVSGLTSALFNESSADNIFDSNPLFYHLREKGSVIEDGGTQIQMPITYKKLTAAGTFKKYGLLDTTPTDSETAAAWKWKYNYVNIIVSDTELWENSGKSQAVNLLKAKVKNGLATLRDNIGSQIYSTNGDGAEGMNGLRLTCSSAGTVGGIASTDFSGWAGKTMTTTALALSLMEKSFLSAAVGSDEPDIIVTTKPVYAKYWTALQANQRFSSEQTAKAGFRYLLFNGVPVFHDSHVPSKHMFMLNSRWLYLYLHNQANFAKTSIGAMATQAVHIDRYVVGGNLVTDNRRMHHMATSLNYT